MFRAIAIIDGAAASAASRSARVLDDDAAPGVTKSRAPMPRRSTRITATLSPSSPPGAGPRYEPTAATSFGRRNPKP